MFQCACQCTLLKIEMPRYGIRLSLDKLVSRYIELNEMLAPLRQDVINRVICREVDSLLNEAYVDTFGLVIESQYQYVEIIPRRQLHDAAKCFKFNQAVMYVNDKLGQSWSSLEIIDLTYHQLAINDCEVNLEREIGSGLNQGHNSSSANAQDVVQPDRSIHTLASSQLPSQLAIGPPPSYREAIAELPTITETQQNVSPAIQPEQQMQQQQHQQSMVSSQPNNSNNSLSFSTQPAEEVLMNDDNYRDLSSEETEDEEDDDDDDDDEQLSSSFMSVFSSLDYEALRLELNRLFVEQMRAAQERLLRISTPNTSSIIEEEQPQSHQANNPEENHDTSSVADESNILSNEESRASLMLRFGINDDSTTNTRCSALEFKVQFKAPESGKTCTINFELRNNTCNNLNSSSGSIETGRANERCTLEQYNLKGQFSISNT